MEGKNTTLEKAGWAGSSMELVGSLASGPGQSGQDESVRRMPTSHSLC